MSNYQGVSADDYLRQYEEEYEKVHGDTSDPNYYQNSYQPAADQQQQQQYTDYN